MMGTYYIAACALIAVGATADNVAAELEAAANVKALMMQRLRGMSNVEISSLADLAVGKNSDCVQNMNSCTCTNGVKSGECDYCTGCDGEVNCDMSCNYPTQTLPGGGSIHQGSIN